MQYELHMLWRQHTRESKNKEHQDIRVIHLRNELMFFVDNLQYYIQVDVLESKSMRKLSNSVFIELFLTQVNLVFY